MPNGRELLDDASSYVEQHKVFQLFESLLQNVLIEKPEDPIEHLIRQLNRESVPRIVVAGPPGAQSQSVCELLAAKANLVHVIASEVWRELVRYDSPLGKEAKGLNDAGKPIPDDLMLRMLQEKLTSGECVSLGWVLEGYPSTAAQTRGMLAAGLLPTRFLHIGVSDAEVVRRLTGRRVDPVGNAAYHVSDKPPPDAETAARLVTRPEDTEASVRDRLGAYRRSIGGVLPQFEKVLKELEGSKAGEAGVSALIEAALPMITSEMPTRAPRGCARVLLLGGPGSRVEELGAMAASQYGCKLLSAIDLLHGEAIRGSKAAKAAMKTSDPLRAVADDIVGKLLLSRLQDDDVRTSGFVIVGYPATQQQAAWLKKQKVWARHVVHVDMAPAAALAQATGALYDPFDGEVYHKAGPMPSDEETLKRLVPHPKQSQAVVKKSLQQWHSGKSGLLKFYGKEVLTEDGTRPQRELIERLATAFLAM